MSLLTRVKLVCTDGDDIFINDGVYGGLMEFMQVPELQPPYRVIRDGKVLTATPSPGKSSDRPAIHLMFCRIASICRPICKDDDFIEFGTLGAYGIATSTLFNGYGSHGVVAVDSVFNG